MFEEIINNFENCKKIIYYRKSTNSWMFYILHTYLRVLHEACFLILLIIIITNVLMNIMLISSSHCLVSKKEIPKFHLIIK